MPCFRPLEIEAQLAEYFIFKAKFLLASLAGAYEIRTSQSFLGEILCEFKHMSDEVV